MGINLSQNTTVLQGMPISVLMVSEKHILQLKFQQKFPIDNQKIKKKVKEEIYWSLVELSVIYSVFNVSDTSISYM